MILPTDTSPDTANNHQDMPNQKQMAFTPDSRRGNDQDTRHTSTAQVIPRQQSSSRKCNLLVVRNCNCIRSQDGAGGCAQNGHE
jgi:hypothetical protein